MWKSIYAALFLSAFAAGCSSGSLRVGRDVLSGVCTAYDALERNGAFVGSSTVAAESPDEDVVVTVENVDKE